MQCIADRHPESRGILEVVMDRQKLLGLSAMLNVVQATLDQEGREYKAAANHVNAAVVEIHHAAKWSADDQTRMAEIHARQCRTCRFPTDGGKSVSDILFCFRENEVIRRGLALGRREARHEDSSLLRR